MVRAGLSAEAESDCKAPVAMSEKREEAQKARKWVQKGQLECNESTQLFLQLLQQAEKGSLQPLPQELKDEEKDELKEKEEQDLKKKKQGKNGMGQKVGFVGLGAMGGGMALALHKEGFDVCGFDVSLLLPSRPETPLPLTVGSSCASSNDFSGVGGWLNIRCLSMASFRCRKLHAASSGMLSARLAGAPGNHVQVLYCAGKARGVLGTRFCAYCFHLA